MLRNKHSCQGAFSANGAPTWALPGSAHLGPTWMLAVPPGQPVTQSSSANQAAWEGSSQACPLCSWSQAWITSALLVMWILKNQTILSCYKKWPEIIRWIVKWNIQGFENIIPPTQVNICRLWDHKQHKGDVDLIQDTGLYWEVPRFKESAKGISAVHSTVHSPLQWHLSLNNNFD